jgi:hypothetical protein
VTVGVIILEPWKDPSYTRQNTPFAVGAGGRTPARGRRVELVDYLVTVKDRIAIPWEEVESRQEGLEDEYFFEEVEDISDVPEPASKEKKPYQSSFSFDCEDMASPYGSSGERGVQRFFGTIGTIEVDDFKRDFTMWCELQKSRNPNFNPYMVWRALFGCLEEAPLANYGELESANFTAIVAWRNFYAPDYADVFGGVPRVGTSNDKGKDKKEER